MCFCVPSMCALSKNGAKIGIKKKRPKNRDSFGTFGTLSVLSVQNRYKNGTKFLYYYSVF